MLATLLLAAALQSPTDVDPSAPPLTREPIDTPRPAAPTDPEPPLVEFELNGIPCGTDEHWWITANYSTEDLTAVPVVQCKPPYYGPDTYRQWPVDSTGRGNFFPPGAPGTALQALDRGRDYGGQLPLEVADVIRTDDAERWILRPSVPVVSLIAPGGGRVEISPHATIVPYNGTVTSMRAPDRLTTRRWSVDTVTVFLDGQPLGHTTMDALFASPGGVVDVTSHEYTEIEPNVRFTLLTGGETPGSLKIQPTARLFEVTDGSRRLEYGIAPPDDYVQNAATVGRWAESGPGHWTASCVLPPGRYAISLDRRRRPDCIRVTPIDVSPRGVEQFELDLVAAKTWVIAGRPRSPARSIDRAVSLMVGAGSTRMARCASHHWGNPFVHGTSRPGAPDDAYVAALATFDGPPLTSVLIGAPGANGMEIPLRTTSPDDDAPWADLIAELPRARMFSVPLKQVSGGSFLGYTVQSPRRYEPMWPRFITGHVERTVWSQAGQKFGLLVRTPRAHGVVVEASAKSPTLVRDWFTVEGAEVRLLGDGAGRQVKVTSALEVPVHIFLRPRPVEGLVFELERCGYLHPGQTAELWLPASAQSILAHGAQQRWVTQDTLASDPLAVAPVSPDLDSFTLTRDASGAARATEPASGTVR